MLKESTAFSSFSTNKLLDTYLFYKDILNLEVNLINDQFMHIELPGGNLLAIYDKEDHKPSSYTVLNFQIGDVEIIVDQLTKKGVQFLQYGEPFNTNRKGIAYDNQGSPIAWFVDPGKNVIALME